MPLPLRSFNLPDVGDHLIHFTGRAGARVDEVPPELIGQRPDERLVSLLRDGRVRSYPPFGATEPVSCFTESVASSVRALIGSGRYTPHAVGFHKQVVFDRGGGPVWYLRGDRWRDVHDVLSSQDRSMTVRYWPGVANEEKRPLTQHLNNESEWIHEREWRVRGDMEFSLSDVAFVIVPKPGLAPMLARELRVGGQYEAADQLDRVPEVVINTAGTTLHDPTDIFVHS